MHSFHNFCNVKTKNKHLIGNEAQLAELKATPKHRKPSRAEQDATDYTVVSLSAANENDDEDSEENDVDGSRSDDESVVTAAHVPYSYHIYNPTEWKKELFNSASLMKLFVRPIYSFKVCGEYEGFAGDRMVRVRVIGQAFMLK